MPRHKTEHVQTQVHGKGNAQTIYEDGVRDRKESHASSNFAHIPEHHIHVHPASPKLASVHNFSFLLSTSLVLTAAFTLIKPV